MSTIWTKSAVSVASAALLAMAVLPAFAQSEETQPPTEMQAPPSEIDEQLPSDERQSKPKYSSETPRELRLPDRAMAAGKCRSGADTEAEAEEDCAAKLNCQPPTKVKCQYRGNNQDWICSCK